MIELAQSPPRAGVRALSAEAIASVPPAARARLLDTAEQLLGGRAVLLGVERCDLAAPDWHWDPRTGRRAPADLFAFDVPYRDEAAVGDVKQLWELSRHHHLTVLSAAYACTKDSRYAERVADHLKSWWAANPPLRGVQWVSGIELGIRLISWAWVRRLLADWPAVAGLFEENPQAIDQIYHHQRWLAALPSVGSSANNHVVAEAAGRVVAACAFPWFPQSPAWRAASMRMLLAEIEANTFASGLNRELATEYHGLVLELGLLALAEADSAGFAFPDGMSRTLLRASDALAAIVDVRLRPPRQGDGDDGHGLVVDGDWGERRWASCLATAQATFDRCDWWPPIPADDVRSTWLSSLLRARRDLGGRLRARPFHFADAGMTILRTSATGVGEIWCRADSGPHGFLSIAAHAHADALSIEVRLDGVDVLADPGTYCYHGQPDWRAWFRSTLGHNTLALAGRDQSESGGPFLWTRHARSRTVVAHQEDGQVGRWTGEHEGYLPSLGARHRRTVTLDPRRGAIKVYDWAPCADPLYGRLAFHLGPSIQLELGAGRARLTWTARGAQRAAVLDLPSELQWSAYRGQSDPPMGWYSESFGSREPAWTLIGEGRFGGAEGPVVSTLTFLR